MLVKAEIHFNAKFFQNVIYEIGKVKWVKCNRYFGIQKKKLLSDQDNIYTGMKQTI